MKTFKSLDLNKLNKIQIENNKNNNLLHKKISASPKKKNKTITPQTPIFNIIPAKIIDLNKGAIT